LFAPFASRAQQVRRVGILVVQAERDAQVQSNVAGTTSSKGLLGRLRRGRSRAGAAAGYAGH
jgi:hypothetical protein